MRVAEFSGYIKPEKKNNKIKEKRNNAKLTATIFLKIITFVTQYNNSVLPEVFGIFNGTVTKSNAYAPSLFECLLE